jgi:DNA-binding CsgD family transcriptional regulator
MKISPNYFVVLIVIQGICATIFAADAISDIFYRNNQDWHDGIEIIASTALVLSMILETRNLIELLQRKTNLERTLKNASMEIHAVIEAKFHEWCLSPSEQDVAGLVVKGLSTAETAKVRGTSEGTVKAQLNAIYRKADARNRADLMSQILDAMIDRPLLENTVSGKALIHSNMRSNRF